jgi:hypothetical protein
VWIAWHLGGMGWQEYLDLPVKMRRQIVESLAERIREDNEALERAKHEGGS